ncbi:MAG: radical SAM protein [Candidatus Deferrimicrobiaceae bacterium]
MAQSPANSLGKILLIELLPTVPNLGRFIVMPRFGLLAIASILSERTDYEVKLLFEPYVGAIDAERIEQEEPRFVLVNGLTSTAPDNERVLGSLRERLSDGITVIAGGEHATMYPDEARRYADFILGYEGDETIVLLLEALEENDPVSRNSMLSQIPGLSYRGLSGKWRFNEEVERVQTIDYRYDFSVVPGSESAAKRFRTAHIPLQTSRGCNFSCSFCSWISLYGKAGYVLRPVDDVLHDILHAMAYTGVRNFIVSDNLFAGDVAYTEELMHRILRAFEGRSDKPRLTVLCRADQFAGGDGSIPEKTIRLMAKGGVTNVSMGLESISGRSLLQMRKRSGLPEFHAAAECLRRNGIGMLATFVAGFDGDSYEDVVNIAEFGERLGLFTIQPYARGITPGTIDEILSESRLIPRRLNKYFNGHCVSVLPAQMLPSDLQRGIFEAAFRFHRMGEGKRKPALRVFQFLWNAIQPHYRGLLRLEREVLVPEGIYRQNRTGYLLNEKNLHAVTGDEDRYLAYAEKAEAIFLEADRAVSGQVIPIRTRESIA